MATKNVILKFIADSNNLKSGLKQGRDELGKFQEKGTLTMASIGNAAIKGFQIAAVAAAAFAVAATVSSVKVGAAFEASMTEARAVANATGAEYEAMSGKARELGATTSFTAQQSAESFVILSRAGLDVAASIAAIDSTMILAGASSTDLSIATSAVVSTLAQFNLEAQESGRVADVFAAAASNSQFSVAGLTQSMKFAGTTGAVFGQTLEETAAATMMLRNFGLRASQVGRTYRMAMTQMAAGTGDQKDILAQLGLTMADVDIETNSFGEILQTLADAGMGAKESMKFFGQEAGASIGGLILSAQKGENEFKEFTETLGDSAGTAERQYAMMMDTVKGKTDIAKSAIEEIKLAFFDVISDDTKNALDEAGKLFQFIGAVIRENTPLFISMGDQIQASFAPLLNMNPEIEEWETVIQTAMRAVIVGLGIVQSAITGVRMMFLTLKLVFNGVADGMVTGVLTIIQHWKWLKFQIANAFITAMDVIVEANVRTLEFMAKGAGVFSDKLEAKMNGVAASIRSGMEGAKDSVSGFKNEVELANSALAIQQEEASDRANDTKLQMINIADDQMNSYTQLTMAYQDAGQITLNVEKEKQDAIATTLGMTEAEITAANNLAQAEKDRLAAAAIAPGADVTPPEKESEQLKKVNSAKADMERLSTKTRDERFQTRRQEIMDGDDGQYAGMSMSEKIAQWDLESQGLYQTMQKVGLSFEGVKNFGIGVFSSLEDGMSTFIMDFATGAQTFGDSIKSMFAEFGKSILSMLAKVVAKMATMKLLELVAGFGTGGLSTLATSILGGMGSRHTGGAITKDGEYRLQRGEYVINEKTMSSPGVAGDVQQANRQGGANSASRTINVQLPNTPLKPFFKEAMRPGGAFALAVEELGGKLVIG